MKLSRKRRLGGENMNFAANKVRSELEKRGMPVATAARRANIPAELLRRSLNGERQLKADEFVMLCKVLGLNIEDFPDTDAS